MAAGKSLIQMMWDVLDATYEELYYSNNNTPARAAYLWGKLDGVCNLIRITSAPYYEDTDDVELEAETRRIARLAGKYHMTPGCEAVTVIGDKRIANTEMRVPIPGERHAKEAK